MRYAQAAKRVQPVSDGRCELSRRGSTTGSDAEDPCRNAGARQADRGPFLRRHHEWQDREAAHPEHLVGGRDGSTRHAIRD
jgi:hypothetical protein